MLILKQLKHARDKKNVVSIYEEEDEPSSFSCGIIEKITKTHVRLQSYTKFGERSGFEVLALEGIAKVETGGQYEEKLAALLENQSRIFNEVALQLSSSDDMFRAALKQSMEEFVCVGVYTHGAEVLLNGYVKEISKEQVSILLLTENGEFDGISTFKLEDITGVHLNRREQQVMAFLYSLSLGRKMASKA